MRGLPTSAIVRPSSHEDLTGIAERWLRASGSWATLPTPIESLFESAGVVQKDMLELAVQPGFERALELADNSIRRAWQKILGIADLRRRVIYIAKSASAPRQRFTQLHEFSHQAIPWHDVQTRYRDRQCDLAPSAVSEFEREANYMASELLFQGDRFRLIARDFRASADTVFHLADMHLASRHATAWRLVEAQDERIALAMYYPDDQSRSRNEASFRLWRHVSSDSFCRRFPNLEFPTILPPDHPWRASIATGKFALGESTMDCRTDGVQRFEWESWWNSYSLSVMLRTPRAFFGLNRILLGKDRSKASPQ